MEGMRAVNGFVMKDKPVIISYGRAKQCEEKV